MLYRYYNGLNRKTILKSIVLPLISIIQYQTAGAVLLPESKHSGKCGLCIYFCDEANMTVMTSLSVL